jgi:hypothetical protein
MYLVYMRLVKQRNPIALERTSVYMHDDGDGGDISLTN